MHLGGLTVPTPTLFDTDGSVDRDRNRRFVDGICRAGVDHVFPLGSLGEFPSLDEPERATLLAGVFDGLRAPVDVWVGVGAPSTRRAVARSRAAADAGAKAVIAVPPYYLRPTEAAIADYYRAIARESPVPLLAYNIPSKVGYALSPALVHDLAREGVLAGIKDTAGSLDSVRGFLTGAPPGFAVVPGDDPLASAAIAAGAAGAVMGLANIVPKLPVELVRASGRPGDAGIPRLQGLVDRLAHAVSAGPFPSTGKFLAHTLRGAPDGYRDPYGALTDREERAVVAALAPLRAELEPFLREAPA